MLALSLALQAQSIFGTISGTITDSSGSVIPNANVTAKNEASGDIRRSVTNGDGYYTFSSIPAGTYSILVEAPGFQKTQQNGLNLLGAENAQSRSRTTSRHFEDRSHHYRHDRYRGNGR